MRLDGIVAIVTGAGQGIGAAIARTYAAAGATVVAAEIKPHRLERTMAVLRALSPRVSGVVVDVAVREQVDAMVAETDAQYGRVDVLVNNAQSYAPRAPLEAITEERFDRVFASGAKGTLWGMQAVLPYFRRQGGGRIVNFVSLAAERGDPGLGDYNATKAAILALTRTAAREWGRYGILVNCIAPGAMTKRGRDYAARDPEGFARQLAERPLGRLGDPSDDIAPVAVFLASAAARYVTGHVFYVDGGAHLGRA